jgi:glycerol-3-phosphate acyltransferase PlsY
VALVIAVYMIIGFLSGSVPYGVIIAQRSGTDLRQHGSGNIGATNAARVLGKKVGAIVLVLDAAKGAIPTLLAVGTNDWTVAATGFAAITGHCFSPWLKLRGGKGVATALGVFLVVAPFTTLIGVIAFAMFYTTTRVVAIGSLAAAATIAGRLVLLGDTANAILGVATLLLLVFTHRSNIAGLLSSTRFR